MDSGISRFAYRGRFVLFDGVCDISKSSPSKVPSVSESWFKSNLEERFEVSELQSRLRESLDFNTILNSRALNSISFRSDNQEPEK